MLSVFSSLLLPDFTGGEKMKFFLSLSRIVVSVAMIFSSVVGEVLVVDDCSLLAVVEVLLLHVTLASASAATVGAESFW